MAQYDIQANFFQKQNNIVNAMGYISEVRCFNEGYTYEGNYTLLPSKSAYTTPDLAKLMIKAIEKDQIITEKARLGECDPIKFQLAGEYHFLSEMGGGVNCAQWCMEKLAIAHIGNGKGLNLLQVFSQDMNRLFWRI